MRKFKKNCLPKEKRKHSILAIGFKLNIHLCKQGKSNNHILTAGERERPILATVEIGEPIMSMRGGNKTSNSKKRGKMKHQILTGEKLNNQNSILTPTVML